MQEETIFDLIRIALGIPANSPLDIESPVNLSSKAAHAARESLANALWRNFHIEVEAHELEEISTAGGVVWLVEGKQQARQRSSWPGYNAYSGYPSNFR